ncbi:MAG: nitroreductase family protein [Muribaculaceae bacterium]|nr:nitroreductase family protein [Muribaculaceae bacterium]
MKLIKKLRFMLSSAKKAGIIYNQFTDDDFETNRLLGEIIRNTHSIEKGLSLENVRLGFGYAKIKDAASIIKAFGRLNGTIDVEQVRMFADALGDYIEFHRRKNYNSEHFEEIVKIHEEISSGISGAGGYGGTMKVARPAYSSAEIEAVSRVINDRHSVREFEKTPVSETDIRAAISLAMRCPSACNRQCYRVTIIEKSELDLLDGWLEGVGGFADELDKMLLITGRISDYRLGEAFQYVVTPSVFAAYLTITLQLYGIGCCFIQRNVMPNEKYSEVAKRLNIPADEQAVCILGIGNLKEEFVVPVSHRLPYDAIVRRVVRHENV